MRFPLFTALATVLLLTSCNTEKQEPEMLYRTEADPTLYTMKQLDSITEGIKAEAEKMGLDMEVDLKLTDSVVEDGRIIWNYAYELNAKVVDMKMNDDALASDEDDLRITDEMDAMFDKHNSLVGKPLPAFSEQLLDGSTITNENLMGKPTVINLWFTTCKPCIEEMPALNDIATVDGNDDIRFIAMTYESAKQVKPFLESTEFVYEQVIGAKKWVLDATMVFPVTLFVDSAGTVVEVQLGMPVDKNTGELDTTEFVAALDRIRG